MSEESVRNRIAKACTYLYDEDRPQYLFIMSALDTEVQARDAVEASDAVEAAARWCAGLPELEAWHE